MIDTIFQQPRRIGMLAGWGRYPVVIAEALRRQGYETYCLGVVGHADPALAEVCRDFRWSGLAKFGGAIRYMKRHGVTEMVMAGKIFKTRLFQRFAWVRNIPDLRTVRMFFRHFLTRQKDCRDDTLLTAIVNEFAAEGIRFAPATDFAPELLIPAGRLTRRGPDAGQEKDIAFGFRVAKELGRLDIGQSVAVRNETVLAVEAVEGTDACIRRAGALCKAGGFTVVKVAKPQQDMRFDVPTIGLSTLETMAEAGARLLAVEAGKSILLDREKVIELAERRKIVIVAVEGIP
ncbi:MAG: UDP-2,3-diacylglucosamine diphosphatase LpxI [Pirellulales bacterium]|nr:UDP-2,3-diacylglucosamine diphosphatase LpxI [Pirellulales bacterium]